MEPNYNDFDIYSTFPILCAFGYALTMIIQKITSEKDNLYSQTFHLYFAAIIFSILIGVISADGKFYTPLNKDLYFLLQPWIINSYFIFFSLLSIGFITVVGFLCIFQAYRIGSPPSVALYEYIIIVWGLIISWFVWDENILILYQSTFVCTYVSTIDLSLGKYIFDYVSYHRWFETIQYKELSQLMPICMLSS